MSATFPLGLCALRSHERLSPQHTAGQAQQDGFGRPAPDVCVMPCLMLLLLLHHLLPAHMMMMMMVMMVPQVAPGGEPYLLHSKVGTAPAWASAELDPTHKKGRDGKQRPASSFFQLFRPGGGKYAFNLTGDDKEAQAEANELEVELLMELHGRQQVKRRNPRKRMRQVRLVMVMKGRQHTVLLHAEPRRRRGEGSS
ncbi:hypothetical protein COO60DRAFT_1039802 [Scenedesmus sp. NREL 46B-D3]|nr:hypothetical protein COO60DRAFT_1039802 [Scenedesmus sp. NREL 46B-D3]